MLNDDMIAGLNEQINEELFSAYLYGAMANYFTHINLKGFAQWMHKQADEELGHARRIVNYLNDRGARVLYRGIAEPTTDWESPLAAVTDAYKHECHISECINQLSTRAIKSNDHATHAFLEWFVTEQVEEESNASDIMQQLKLIQGAPGSLFILDREMGGRATADHASDSQ